jgi:hypothetical protein
MVVLRAADVVAVTTPSAEVLIAGEMLNFDRTGYHHLHESLCLLKRPNLLPRTIEERNTMMSMPERTRGTTGSAICG